MPNKPELSIIIPSYNDGFNVLHLLEQLKTKVPSAEIIVVESGDSDYFRKIKKSYKKVKLASSRKGRATQQNKGASLTSGRLLWFLHSDSEISNINIQSLKSLKKQTWGGFKVRFSSDKNYYRIIELTSHLRSTLLNTVYGDQGLFITKDLFKKIKGFDEKGMFDDIDISRKLRKISKPKIIDQYIITSPRKFEKKGILYTHFIMILIASAYALRSRSLSQWLYNLIK